MMKPAWPERIHCSQGEEIFQMAARPDSQKAELDNVFGQRRRQPKMFRAEFEQMYVSDMIPSIRNISRKRHLRF
jgi:hypothetical protein